MALAPDQTYCVSFANSIEALSIRTVDGEWRRVPEAWQARVELCQAETVYALHGQQWKAKCCERSVWVCGDSSLCGNHMREALEVGA